MSDDREPDQSRCSNPDHQDPKKWPRNSRWCAAWNLGTPHPAHDIEDEHGDTREHCDGRPERPSQRPPARLYEVRTIHGEVYRAEGHDVQNTAGWFTLWADVATVALRLPEADVRSVRHVTDGELPEPEAEAAVARVRALHRPVAHGGMTICAECSAFCGQSTDNAPVTHPCATIRALDGDTTSKEQQA